MKKIFNLKILFLIIGLTTFFIYQKYSNPQSLFIPDRQYVYNWVGLSPEESSRWSFYQDQTNGFTIKYPKEWIKLEKGGEVIFTPELIDWGPKDSPAGAFVSITILDNQKNYRSFDYAKNYIKSGGFILKNQPNFFSSIDATVVDGLSAAGYPGPTALIKAKNNKIIQIWTDSISDNTLVSKIFSTFKFIQ